MISGSGLFVYTDGVPEVTDGNQKMFGAERMTEVLRRQRDGTPEEITAAVSRAMREFTGDTPRFDGAAMRCPRDRGSVKEQEAETKARMKKEERT